MSVACGGVVLTKITKLNAIQDAALMRGSSLVPIQEAELQFLHNEDMSNGSISLSNNDDYGSTKSLPLDESGCPSDESILCNIDSPHTPSHAPSNQNTLNNLVLRVRSESFLMSDSLIDEVLGQLLTNK
jgi:hypothetical protein